MDRWRELGPHQSSSAHAPGWLPHTYMTRTGQHAITSPTAHENRQHALPTHGGQIAHMCRYALPERMASVRDMGHCQLRARPDIGFV